MEKRKTDKWMLDNGIDPTSRVKVNGRYKLIFEVLDEYHEQQVKSVDLADVGGTLPSNGEIEAYAMYQCGGCSPESCDERAGIITGAKWMRQKLIKLLKQ